MEHLVVEFFESRGVIIDDVEGDWLTNEILDIEAGPHRVSLAPPADYDPEMIRIILHHTTLVEPKRIQFTRLPGPVS